MKKVALLVLAVLSLGGVVYALDDDARFSNTGTADTVGLWCRGKDATETAYTMENGLYYNCTTGEVTIGQGLAADSLDSSSVTSPKIDTGAVFSTKLYDLESTLTSGKILCLKTNGGFGVCYGISGSNFCNSCK